MRPVVVHWLEQFVSPATAAIVAPSWFTCVGLAGVVALFLMLASARRRGIDPIVVATAVLWCYVAAVAAGIVVPMLIDAGEQLVTTGHAQLRWAGMTSFWGYLAGTGAVAIVCRDHDLPLARFGDMAVAPLGVALCFARLGCFLGGCDYGKVTSLPWAVRFPAGSPAWHDHVASGLVAGDRAASLPVHPTQLYEAALGLAVVGLALACSRVRWVRAREGRAFVIAAAAYALARIAIEVVRGDTSRGIYAGLSSGQIFSLFVLAAIAIGMVVARRRALRVVATATIVAATIWLGASSDADAQPAPPPPPPAVDPTPVHGSPTATPPAAPTAVATSTDVTLGKLQAGLLVGSPCRSTGAPIRCRRSPGRRCRSATPCCRKRRPGSITTATATPTPRTPS